MQPAAICLPLLLLLLFTPPSPLPLISADLVDMEEVPAEVKCLESWHCGMRTVTVTTGERLEIDCLEEVMKAMGRFSWRVSWRYSRGIITSDDSLFSRWESSQLDRVLLDPVREENAGTYRCDVQDPAFRRVKRLYVGVRVLPQGVLNLDYDSSLARWEWTGSRAMTGHNRHSVLLGLLVLAPLTLLSIVGLAVAGLYWLVLQRRRRREKKSVGQGADVLLAMEDIGGVSPASDETRL